MAMADPGVCPRFVPVQECHEMAELDTRDPKLKGGLGDCDTSLAVSTFEPLCGAQGSVHSGYSVRTQNALPPPPPLTSAVNQVWVQMACTSGTEHRAEDKLFTPVSLF